MIALIPLFVLICESFKRISSRFTLLLFVVEYLGQGVVLEPHLLPLMFVVVLLEGLELELMLIVMVLMQFVVVEECIEFEE